MNRKIRTLCLLGGSAEDVAQLARFLGTRPDPAWQVGSADAADLLFVDVDSIYGHMDWLKAQNSGRPVVALSTGDAHAAEYRLRKPFTPAALAELLDQFAAQIPARHGVTAPVMAAPPAAQPAVTRAVAQPAAHIADLRTVQTTPAPAAATPPATQMLRDLLDDPARGRKRWRLRRNNVQALLLDGENQQAYALDASLKGVSPWCTQALDSTEIEAFEGAAFTLAAREMTALPYARLGWLAHLLGSNGELEADLDPAGRYKLERWPQSEREFPKHFRIATAMMKTAATVQEIAEASGASTADVANFINAYRSSGHIEVEGAGRETGTEQRRGGLFGRNR